MDYFQPGAQQACGFSSAHSFVFLFYLQLIIIWKIFNNLVHPRHKTITAYASLERRERGREGGGKEETEGREEREGKGEGKGERERGKKEWKREREDMVSKTLKCIKNGMTNTEMIKLIAI